MKSKLRIGQSEEMPLWIRSGNLSLRGVTVAVVVFGAFYVTAGGDNLPGTIVYVILAGYVIIFSLLTYLRCGIWVERDHVRLRNAFNSIRVPRPQIVGIGLLTYRRLSPRNREMEYLHISVLSVTGYWFPMIGMRAQAEVARQAAVRLSEVTGWPIAEGSNRQVARSALLSANTD